MEFRTAYNYKDTSQHEQNSGEVLVDPRGYVPLQTIYERCCRNPYADQIFGSLDKDEDYDEDYDSDVDWSSDPADLGVQLTEKEIQRRLDDEAKSPHNVASASNQPLNDGTASGVPEQTPDFSEQESSVSG